MKKLLALVLTAIAKVNLWRYRPTIVAITGSAGKTTTKNAIAAVLRTKYRVSAPAGTLNDELGVPAAILGDFSGWFGRWYDREGLTAWFWFRILARGLRTAVYTSAYPQVLVLEYGADHPGDIKRLARRFRPSVAVVTRVGEIPVHVEFYASPKELAAEKAQLVRALPASGHAVLNYDDLTVLEMRDATHAPVTTFGLAEGADIRVTDLRVKVAGERPVGMAFNLSVDGSTMPAAVRGTLGRGVAGASAAAVAVGRVFGIGLADASEALLGLPPPQSRMRILDGIKGTVLVDDSYNSSPAAAHLAIETVKDLPGRKVLVLGSMRELGARSVQAHQEVGNMAGAAASELVCVGDGGRFIADAAMNQLPKDKVHWFETSTEAGRAVQALIRTGDVILVKGSQGVRMERIVKEIMAEPARANELIVRQSRRWLAK